MNFIVATRGGPCGPQIVFNFYGAELNLIYRALGPTIVSGKTRSGFDEEAALVIGATCLFALIKQSGVPSAINRRRARSFAVWLRSICLFIYQNYGARAGSWRRTRHVG